MKLKQEKPIDIWSVVNSINSAKLLEWEQIEAVYDPFIINKALSQFPDTVIHANDMNLCYDIPKRNQYFYLINIVRPKKRYTKWAKKSINIEKDEKIELIKTYFRYNEKKAKEVYAILMDRDFIMIKEKLETGGIE